MNGLVTTHVKQHIKIYVAELSDFFTPRASPFTGGPRALANVLEGIDQCIAIRAAQQPSVETFLKDF